MTAPKRKASQEGHDLSHQPTRKVETMSDLLAEMLVRDADETSPGIPALNVDRAIATIPPPAATTPAEESAAIRALRPRAPRVLVVVALLVIAGALAAAAFFLTP